MHLNCKQGVFPLFLETPPCLFSFLTCEFVFTTLESTAAVSFQVPLTGNAKVRGNSAAAFVLLQPTRQSALAEGPHDLLKEDVYPMGQRSGFHAPRA